MDHVSIVPSPKLEKMALASHVHGASRSKLYQGQGQEEYLAIRDGGPLQSTVHSE